ncbi:MAG: hypothetical protein AAGH89_14145 [Verrucomicrobiota bacterium]
MKRTFAHGIRSFSKASFVEVLCAFLAMIPEGGAQNSRKIDPETGKPYLPKFQPDSSGLTSRMSNNAPTQGGTAVDTGRTLQQFQPTGAPPNLEPKTPRRAPKTPAPTGDSSKSPFNPDFGPPAFVPNTETDGTMAPNQTLEQFVPTGPPPTSPTPKVVKPSKQKRANQATSAAIDRDVNDYYRSKSTVEPLKFEPEGPPSMIQDGSGRVLSQFEPTGPPPRSKPVKKPKAAEVVGSTEPKKLPDRFYQQSNFAPVKFEAEESMSMEPQQTLQQFEPTGPPPQLKEEMPSRQVGRTKKDLPNLAEQSAQRQERYDAHYQSEGARPLPSLEPGLGAAAMVDGEVVSGPMLTQFEPTGPPPKVKQPRTKPQREQAAPAGPKPLPDRFYQQSDFAPVTFELEQSMAMEPQQTLQQFEPTGPPPTRKEPKGEIGSGEVDAAALAKLARERQDEIDRHYESQTGKTLPGLSNQEMASVAYSSGVELTQDPRSLTQYVAPPNARAPKSTKPKAAKPDQSLAQAGPKPLPDRFYQQSEFEPVRFDPQSAVVEEPGQMLTQFTPTGPPPAKPEPQAPPVVDPASIQNAAKDRKVAMDKHYQSESSRPLPGLTGAVATNPGEVMEGPRTLTQYQPTGRPPSTPKRKTGVRAAQSVSGAESPAKPEELPGRFYLQSDYSMPTLTPDEANRANQSGSNQSATGPTTAAGRTLRQFEAEPATR